MSRKIVPPNPGTSPPASRVRWLIRQLLTGQYFLSIVARFLGAAFSFVTTLLIARLGGTVISGGYALTLQTVQIGSVISLFGNDHLLVRRMVGDLAENRRDLARAALTHAIRVVGTAAVVVAAGVFAISAFAPTFGASRAVVALSSVGIVSYSLLGLVVGVMRAVGRAVLSQFFFGVVHSALLVLALGTIVLLGLPLTVMAIVACFVLCLLTTVLIGGLIVYRTVREWPRLVGPAPAYKAISSGFIGGAQIVNTVNGWLAMVLIAHMISVGDLGAYRVCSQLTTVIGMIVATIAAVVGPLFAGDFRLGNMARVGQRYIRAIGLSVLFAGPPIAALLIAPGPILSIFGPDFVSASGALQVLAIGQLIGVMTGPVGLVLIMGGYERSNFYLSIASLVLTVILLALVVPRYGLTGATWAIIAGDSLRSIGCLIILIRLLRAAKGTVRKTDAAPI